MLSRVWSSKRLRSPLAAGLALIVAIVACQPGQAPTATTVAVPTNAPAAATTAASPNAASTVDSNVLYFDDFSDINSGWPILQVDNGQAGYQSPDVYRLDASAPNTIVQASHPGAFSDYSLETILTSAAAGSGQWRYGFTFRQVTPDNYYAFLINPRAQTWQVLKRLLGQWTLLAEGSSALPLDPATPTTLRVDALGAAMTFSINGAGVVALTEGTFPAGEIGFVVETLDEASVQVAADEITVRRYDPAAVPPAPTAAPIVPTETQTGTPATPTPTSNRPLNTTPRPTLLATNDLLTAAAGTAQSVSATAAAIASQAPGFTPPALCGLPGLPDCP
jgi:hypothetical protein